MSWYNEVYTLEEATMTTIDHIVIRVPASDAYTWDDTTGLNTEVVLAAMPIVDGVLSLYGDPFLAPIGDDLTMLRWDQMVLAQTTPHGAFGLATVDIKMTSDDGVPAAAYALGDGLVLFVQEVLEAFVVQFADTEFAPPPVSIN